MAQKRRNYKKWMWWGGGVAVILVLVVIGVVIGRINDGEKKASEVTESEIVEKEKQEAPETEQATSDASESDEKMAEKQKVVQYEGDDPNMAETLSGAVTYAGVNGGTLMIRTTIDQYLTRGVCELTLTRGGAIIYSDRVDIVGDVSTASCSGFDIPAAGLGEGNLEININLSADGRQGVIRGGASI